MTYINLKSQYINHWNFLYKLKLLFSSWLNDWSTLAIIHFNESRNQISIWKLLKIFSYHPYIHFDVWFSSSQCWVAILNLQIEIIWPLPIPFLWLIYSLVNDGHISLKGKESSFTWEEGMRLFPLYVEIWLKITIF